ncbi:uncharacterized protein LOC18429230 isoform X1 [Amborella trichopoda]|uniref:uncharacterized protein LOC18429230 isoform X1 n=2 Tax=Amborella trichopoda TaxID=13333 RepID=UPI0005D2F3B7|nr:uncharacterized protein LOC18429230 isoform X1 [Amborella trichopoda]|eukprot:XP_011621523.1 uncharacterized protein LOC18429230 isoform X1 [Amborella trichopoda]
MGVLCISNMIPRNMQDPLASHVNDLEDVPSFASRLLRPSSFVYSSPINLHDAESVLGGRSSVPGKFDHGVLAPCFDYSNRFSNGLPNGDSDPKTSKVNVADTYSENTPGTQELLLRARKEELLSLRKHLADAAIKETQLLIEKHNLEKKFASFRMEFDQQQSDVITLASKALSHRKDDIEENIRLTHALQAAEQDRYTFLSSLPGLLAEYGLQPPVMNASSIVSNTKDLLQHLRQKLNISEASLREMQSQLANRRGEHDHTAQQSVTLNIHNPHVSSASVSSLQQVYDHEHLLAPAFPAIPSLVTRKNEQVMVPSFGVPHLMINDNIVEHPFPNFNGGKEPMNSGYDVPAPSRTRMRFSTGYEGHGNSQSDDEDPLPSISGLQIVGDPVPGCELLACGYPINGTSACMFEWVRHLPDGTMQYVEGANQPYYVVTADDVDKLLAVVCTPMDDQDRQGELQKIFANNQRKIACDPEMQQEINSYISSGHTVFDVLLLMDSSEDWEPATLHLKKSSYEIRRTTQDETVREKYSRDISMRIPSGLSVQCVLTSSDGTSYPLSTNEVRLRDTLVLTMRIFQRQALDRKKGKA